jgi:hypothetical protein
MCSFSQRYEDAPYGSGRWTLGVQTCTRGTRRSERSFFAGRGWTPTFWPRTSVARVRDCSGA